MQLFPHFPHNSSTSYQICKLSARQDFKAKLLTLTANKMPILVQYFHIGLRDCQRISTASKNCG